MAALHGPYGVSSQMQVKLPMKLARAMRLVAGDEFYWRVSDEDPAVLLFIPVEVLERRYEAGRSLEGAPNRPQVRDVPPGVASDPEPP